MGNSKQKGRRRAKVFSRTEWSAMEENKETRGNQIPRGRRTKP